MAEVSKAQLLGFPVAIPSLKAVAQWLGMVINAHLVALALLPKAHQVSAGT